MTKFVRIAYTDLNSRQKENYNFQKVAAALADYGFNCLPLTDDWQGADFIACHIDGETFLKVQLKSRMSIDRKYLGKNIHIAFIRGSSAFLYDHYALVKYAETNGHIGQDSVTWHRKGIWHWPSPPKWVRPFLIECAL